MTDKAETVILIHGLWMHGLALIPLQRRLRDEGIVVRRFSYPSWLGSLTDNIDLLSTFVNESPGAIIHLVAHSLGGLIVLKMLSQETNARIGRVVLLGTPFAGCHCGVTIAATPMLAALVGRTLAEWFRLSRPALPSAVEIGVIAGTCSIGIGRLIPGLVRPNDGMVAVDETCIAEAQDSIALNVSHSGMLLSRVCARQIANFLKTGSFIHA